MNLMNMEKKFIRSNSNSDRISDLPEPIRKHILSFLPTKKAVTTSILSNSWRALWIDLPNLNLGKGQVSKLSTMMKYHDNVENNERTELVVKKREEFYGFLDRVLESNSQLKKLDLCVPCYGDALKSRLDHWLERAVGRGVKELILDIDSWKFPMYSLPKSVLGGNSITKLKLHKCDINTSSLVDKGLPALQELSLDYVGLDDEVMESLPTNCPNLEVLIFKRCYRLTRFVVSGLIKLTTIYVEISQIKREIETIEIEAPNLLEFTYMNECDMDAETCEIEVLDCKNLRRLRLYGAQLSDDDLNPLLEGLPILEQLELCHCNRLQHVHISNQHLAHLEFTLCMALYKAEVKTPNLKTFRYRHYQFMTIVSKGSALKLTEANIYLKFSFGGRKWHAEFVKFLAKLHHCEHLTLAVASEEDIMVPEKVMMKSRPPLHGVKQLVVELRASLLNHTRVKLVQALLWLAPCLESLTIYNNSIPVFKFLKFTYERPLKGEKKCGCWKSLAIKCWRHALTEVSLENREGDEDDTKLANFFSKARIDGKLVSFVKKERRVGDRAFLIPPSSRLY